MSPALPFGSLVCVTFIPFYLWYPRGPHTGLSSGGFSQRLGSYGESLAQAASLPLRLESALQHGKACTRPVCIAPRSRLERGQEAVFSQR